MIERIHERVDAFFEEARAAGGVTCRPGCTGCCEVDLTVFQVEAGRIAACFAALPEAERTAAAQRARDGQHCAMLSPQGRCVVYEARPLICRTHGLALLLSDGTLDHCPLNYREAPPARQNVLVLDRVNEPLAVAEHLSGGDGRRVRVADIAAGRFTRDATGASSSPGPGPRRPPRG